ncbi:uncharacterized protein Z520_03197 [Fonsecaea multimorphosa CBS 102226]|uniref:ML-like domain-containing protein n=1 Tax=Fonsecaea multimorphosa CBS 102226 TaxID=1442371 RepID=A0A0D2KUW5_9EURO|nr:uncharacterized protein Z520_03197 [Fonsecaea multimorphosa CBS 102226]KIY00534.1 hypothetical protein Z520_03197 [Fonsecaea multimorphosa CBS 102226]OAL18930.1 hypothetical protein AYO22_10259 [Fonsecaea multimorphosa]
MSRKHFSTITCLLFVLITIASAVPSPLSLLSPRQQQSNQPICSEYSTIANLSIVGANSTYRAAYLKASPQGYDPASAPLDSAIPKLPSFQFNASINAECGNLTEVAIKGAATNFTQGQVLQFNINSAVQMRAGSLGMAVIMAIVVATVMDIL